ncbi:MAG: hypothetical protein JWR30_2071 [Conexibacter sp.]|jgi:hypothetical protein|nr:hypothetical protein [Conexibacter sp.]MCZ4495352.1 hypothetical protein [Conexibacter sp.]MDX6715501.1 hypothetical protein [Baekduia sp.]
MKMPFRRSPSMPERMLQKAAAGAGVARLAVKQRTLRPHSMRSKSGAGLTRVMHRG